MDYFAVPHVGILPRSYMVGPPCQAGALLCSSKPLCGNDPRGIVVLNYCSRDALVLLTPGAVLPRRPFFCTKGTVTEGHGPRFSRQAGDYVQYRRGKDSDTWHWCRKCSNWPMGLYFEQYGKPDPEELCNECKAKEEHGTCQKEIPVMSPG